MIGGDFTGVDGSSVGEGVGVGVGEGEDGKATGDDIHVSE